MGSAAIGGREANMTGQEENLTTMQTQQSPQSTPHRAMKLKWHHEAEPSYPASTSDCT